MSEVQVHEGMSTTSLIGDDLSDVLAAAATDVKGKYVGEISVLVDMNVTNKATGKHPWNFTYESLREGRV